jgi:hypothetical protein
MTKNKPVNYGKQNYWSNKFKLIVSKVYFKMSLSRTYSLFSRVGVLEFDLCSLFKFGEFHSEQKEEKVSGKRGRKRRGASRIDAGTVEELIKHNYI